MEFGTGLYWSICMWERWVSMLFLLTRPFSVVFFITSGAVKLTPAHDPNDFEAGKRHNLEFINILNDDGTLNENGAPYTVCL